MSEILRIDREYATWVQDISKRFKRSQIKAATAVNSEMLLFYWELGADIVEKKCCQVMVLIFTIILALI